MSTPAQERAHEAIQMVLEEIKEHVLKEIYGVQYEEDIPEPDRERFLSQVAMAHVSVISALLDEVSIIHITVQDALPLGTKRDLCASTVKELVAELRVKLDIRRGLD